MVRHIIMFKLKESVDETEHLQKAQYVKKELEKLKDRIDVIKFLEVGINVVSLPYAFDLVLNTDFETLEDLESYRTHPAHREFVEFNKNFSISKVSIDYLTN